MVKSVRLSRKTYHLKLVSHPVPVDDETGSAVFAPPTISRKLISPAVGFSKLSDVVDILSRHRAFRTFWVNRSFDVSLSELNDQGVDLTKLTFTTAQKTFVVMKHALEEGKFPILIAPKKDLKDEEIEELRELSQRASAAIYLLA